MIQSTNVQTPQSALDALRSRLTPVDTERVALAEAAGRCLAEPVVADRDHPACNVAAMDGYAVAMEVAQASSTRRGPVPITGEVAMGQPPPELPRGATIRVFTGGAVPNGADLVVRREQVQERPDSVVFNDHCPDVKQGANIRRRGENVRAGEAVLKPGDLLSPSAIAGLATFGIQGAQVRRRVRVAVLVTGSEVRDVMEQPSEHAIRDANGPSLHALLGGLPWVEATPPRRVADHPETLRNAVDEALNGDGEARPPADAVWLTGGVSMGDHDYVPRTLQAAGVAILFHRLPIRPGRPLLGGVGPEGQPVLGFPGNPVSALTTALVFGLPALATRAGRPEPWPIRVRLRNADHRQIPLWWYRLARRVGTDTVEILNSQGSGDVASLARSDGVVQIPPEGEKPPVDDLFFWSWNP